MQPTIQVCFLPYRDPPHASLNAQSCCCGMLHPKLLCARGLFVFLRELKPSVLQSCLTHCKWRLGCARRGEPLVAPAGTSQSIAQSWLLRLCLGVLSGPTALSFHMAQQHLALGTLQPSSWVLPLS